MTTRNQRDLDDLLSDHGGQLGALYGRLSKAQPPRRLDRHVLAEASRAVHGRPRGARWLLGLGTAAGVLLAAGIAWRVNTDLIRQRDGAVQSAPAVAPSSAAAPAVIPVQAHAAPANRAAGSAAITSKGFDGPASDDVVVTGSRTKPAPAALPIETKAAQASAKLRRSESVAKPAAEMRVQAAEPAAMSESEAFAPAPPPPPAPTAASVAAPAPAPAASADVAAARPELQKSEQAGGTATSDSAPAPAAVAESTDAAAAIGAVRDRARATLPAANLSIETVILQIRALLADGRRDAAIAALRDLRRQHSDVVLPDDLRALER